MLKRKESVTRLPYPAGDYASPPDTFSLNNSLPSLISSTMQPLSMTIPGLPLYTSSGLGTLAGTSYSTTSLSSLSSSLGGDRPLSPPTQPKFVSVSSTSLNRMASPTPTTKGWGLPPLKSANTNKRQTSVSPMPMAGMRKWYTVALGGLITAPPDEDEFSLNAASSFDAATNTNTNTEPPAAAALKRVGIQWSFFHVIGGSFFSSPMGGGADDDSESDGDNEGKGGEGEETINKSSGIKLRNTNGTGINSNSNVILPSGPGAGNYKSMATTSPSPSSTRRMRHRVHMGMLASSLLRLHRLLAWGLLHH